MSLPSFPNTENLLSREEVINQIISSIAMEELGLSHIINAEGEKLQYALGTIPGVSGPDEPLTMDQLLDLNKSIQKTLDSTMMNQFLLKEKLLSALSAAIMQGPTGPTGPQGPATIAVSPDTVTLDPDESARVDNVGPSAQEAVLLFGIPRGVTGAAGATILDSYDSYQVFIAAHPTGTQGDAYLVENKLYVWSDEGGGSWVDMGSLVGPTGATGAAGASILGAYDDFANFIADHPTGTAGDAYLVSGTLYVWNEEDEEWKSMGSLIGPEGPTGPTGAAGEGIEILGSYVTLQDLQNDHPTGTQGEVYAVDGILHYWDEGSGAWLPIENLHGPTGPTGPTGEQGPTGMTGEQGLQGVMGIQGIQGEPGLSGVIQGIYVSEAELVSEQPIGQDGIFYLVGNLDDGYMLYVWNSEAAPPAWTNTGAFTGAVGPQGPQGEPGPQGPAGHLEVGEELFGVSGPQGAETIAAGGTLAFESDSLNITVEPGPTVRIETPTDHTGGLIPFATGDNAVAMVTNSSGGASNMVLSAFGGRSASISITTTGFSFPSGNNHFYTFPLAHDIKVKSIYATMTNYDTFTPPTGSSVYPYVILATAARDSNNFTFLPSTKARALLPWSGGSSVQANSNLYAALENIDEVIPAGSRVAICCMYEMENGTNTVIGYYFYFSGSIYYE